MKTNVQVSCPACGAQRFVEVDPLIAEDAIQMRRLAFEGCNCEAAALHRGMERTKQSIEQLLGKGAKERGYDYELLDDTVNAITRLCEDMLKQNFDKVQLEEPNGDMIKMVVDGNRVKITRIQKRQMTL